MELTDDLNCRPWECDLLGMQPLWIDQNRDGVAILVALRTHSPKSVRINITLPEDVLRTIDSFAEANGLSRSGFLARAARREIDRSDAA